MSPVAADKFTCTTSEDETASSAIKELSYDDDTSDTYHKYRSPLPSYPSFFSSLSSFKQISECRPLHQMAWA